MEGGSRYYFNNQVSFNLMSWKAAQDIILTIK